MSRANQKGLRSETVRESNLLTILRSLHLRGSASRSKIGADTGLTRSAVGALVSELTEQGYVREVRPEPDGRRGRPSPLVQPRSENLVLAVEILVDSVAVAAVGLGGPVLRSVRRDRSRDQTEVGRTVADITNLASSVVQSLDDNARIWSLGIAVPGLVRQADNQVIVAPNLRWDDVALVSLLDTSLGLNIPIVAGNEADLAALAESRRGAVAGIDDVVYLSGEVGIGGGCIAAGQIVEGQSGFAGEVGHIPVNIDGQQCNCGSFGCFETEAGEEALLRRAGRPVDGGRAALAELFESADAGDPDVLSALGDHGRWLGFGIAGLANIFNPNAIVLGGFLGPALPFVRKTLEEELDRRVLDVIRADLSLFASKLGPDAPLLGAAELAWNRSLIDMVGESV